MQIYQKHNLKSQTTYYFINKNLVITAFDIENKERQI